MGPTLIVAIKSVGDMYLGYTKQATQEAETKRVPHLRGIQGTTRREIVSLSLLTHGAC